MPLFSKDSCIICAEEKGKLSTMKTGTGNRLCHACAETLGFSATSGSDLLAVENMSDDELIALATADKEMEAARLAHEQERNRATSGMLVTSGFNFDGYTVTKYGPHIASDDIHKEEMRPGFWSGGQSDQDENISLALTELRRKTLLELKGKAHELGYNAITGLDFSYTTLGPFNTNSHHGSDARNNLAYYIFLTYKGNAVIIKKS